MEKYVAALTAPFILSLCKRFRNLFKVLVTVTVNGDRYRTMLNEFLFTKIKEDDIGTIWFLYGSTCHTVEATLDVLRPVFENRIIGRWRGRYNQWRSLSGHVERIFVHKN